MRQMRHYVLNRILRFHLFTIDIARVSIGVLNKKAAESLFLIKEPVQLFFKFQYLLS